MAPNSEDAKVNLCRIGSNFYQGQTQNGVTFGYGTLFDSNREQFIIGIFKQNRLVEFQTAQFLIKNTTCNIRKFNESYLFECEKENYLAKISILFTEINISNSFDKIFEKICESSKVTKIYEDGFSEKINNFCSNLEQEFENLDWKKCDNNLPLKIFDFYQFIQNNSTIDDLMHLIRLLGSIPVFFRDINQKQIVINNEFARRNEIFKFPKIFLNVDLYQILKQIILKLGEKYRSYLLMQNFTILQEHIKSLVFPSMFLIRISDLTAFVKAKELSAKYKIPFNIGTIFKLVTQKAQNPKQFGFPVIMKFYPELMEAMGTEMTLLREKSRAPFDIISNKLIIQKDTIKKHYDKISFCLCKMQISFLQELLDYYNPEALIKEKVYEGPHKDYSIHSKIIQSKSMSFYDKNFKGQLPEDIRIWYDMLDLNIITLYKYGINNINNIESKLMEYGMLGVEFLHNYSDHFAVFSTKIFNIFKNVFQEKNVSQKFSSFQFVKILTDIMQVIVNNLFDLFYDLTKRRMVKNVLKRLIDVNSNVLESVEQMKKDIEAICL